MVEQTRGTVLFGTSTGRKRRWSKNGGRQRLAGTLSIGQTPPSGATCAARGATPLIAGALPSGTGRRRTLERGGAWAVASAGAGEIWRHLGGASRSPRPTAARPQPQLPTAARQTPAQPIGTMPGSDPTFAGPARGSDPVQYSASDESGPESTHIVNRYGNLIGSDINSARFYPSFRVHFFWEGIDRILLAAHRTCSVGRDQ